MHINWSATVSFETLRVFVVGKNYRVQNIQLSKIRWGALPPNPRLGRLRGPKAPLRFLAESLPQHSLSNLLTSGTFRSATRAALNDRCRRRCRRSSKASSLHRNFSKNPACVRRRDDAIGPTRGNFSARAVRLRLSSFSGTTFRIHPRAKSWWRIPVSNR